MSTTTQDARIAELRTRNDAPRPAPRAARAPWRGYDGTSYYGMQAVKPSPFDWRIGVYLFVSGVAGAAQIIAALCQRIAPERMNPVLRNARYVAVAGAASGALLLITDLKTPGRFYNMLRIYRRTSPMSWGSYILTAFGALSGVTALGEWLRTHPTAAHAGAVTQLPAAAAGAGMLTYTGAMLSSTSTPLWAAESPLLSARFAASGMAAGAAALSLAEQIAHRPGNAYVLDHVMVTGAVTYKILSRAAHGRLRARGLFAPLEEPPYGPLYKLGGTLIFGLPAICHVLAHASRRHSGVLRAVAAISVLAGTVASRHAYLHAGIESAKRPADYLRYADGDDATPATELGHRTTP